MATNNIPSHERLIVALDVPTAEQARAFVMRMGDTLSFYKIGMELHMAPGFFELLDWLKTQNKKVFVDLKFFDIPETVARAVKNLGERGADFCTLHGNQSIMEAGARSKTGSLKVLAVTALTSLDQGDLSDLGFQCNVADLVLSRARRALAAGCDGVVSSGLEVERLRAGATTPESAESGKIVEDLTGWRPARRRRTCWRAHLRDPRHPSGREPSRSRPEAHHDARSGHQGRRGLSGRRPPHPRCRRPAGHGARHPERDCRCAHLKTTYFFAPYAANLCRARRCG